MNKSPLTSILSTGKANSPDAYRRNLRELIQKICLLGLWRGAFFEHAAFYGGTALRMLYGLERFSEDLDFSLLKEAPDFSLASYLAFVRRELAAWGIIAQTELIQKKDTNIESAFVKAKTLQTLINFEIPASDLRSLHRDELSSVKFEIDPHPPCAFASESRYILEPIPFSVRVMSLQDLFAGKMHAVLARGWLSRVKGRDWYDLIWFIRSGASLNLPHLEARLKQSGHFPSDQMLSEDRFRQILKDRIFQIDFRQAAEDVMPFIEDTRALESWSDEFFIHLVEKIQI